MKPGQYAGFPDELTVREARVDHQVLVTTLYFVNHAAYRRFSCSFVHLQVVRIDVQRWILYYFKTYKENQNARTRSKRK